MIVVSLNCCSRLPARLAPGRHGCAKTRGLTTTWLLEVVSTGAAGAFGLASAAAGSWRAGRAGAVGLADDSPSALAGSAFVPPSEASTFGTGYTRATEPRWLYV